MNGFIALVISLPAQSQPSSSMCNHFKKKILASVQKTVERKERSSPPYLPGTIIWS